MVNAGGAGGGAVSVARAGDEHAAALAEFYRVVGWDQAATADRVLAARRRAAERNPVTPGEPPATFILLRDDRVLGHVTTIPVRITAGGRDHPAHWLKGLMVHPDHRNGPVGMLVLKEAAARVHPALAMVVDRPALRLYQALGFRDLGTLADHIRLLRPGRVLARVDAAAFAAGRPLAAALVRWLQRSRLTVVAGAAARGAAAAFAALRGRAPRATVEPFTHVSDTDLDELWRTAAAGIAAAPARDGRALRAAYDERDGPYAGSAVRIGGALRAVACLRAPRASEDPRIPGLRVAVLSDAVVGAGDPAAALALVAAAERQARSWDADALLCGASHAALIRALRRRAFVPLPGTVHALVRREAADPWPDHIAAWWLTRGDSHADEAF
jgi:GNAT superfamily N-acetyltransferase